MSLKLLFAPFRGISLKAYRNAFASNIGGIDTFYAPFISGTGRFRINTASLKDLLPDAKDNAPGIPQYIGNSPQEMTLLANTLQSSGLKELNWNLGCPFSRIANKKRGCGLLPVPEEIDRILEVYFNTSSLPLSIKTRLGYKTANELDAAIQVFNKYPLQYIIIHPRTGIQRYGERQTPGCISFTGKGLYTR